METWFFDNLKKKELTWSFFSKKVNGKEIFALKKEDMVYEEISM